MLVITTLMACSQKHTKPTPANAEIQSQAKVNDNISNTNAIRVGYQDEYDKLPIIILDSITESEFVAAYQPAGNRFGNKRFRQRTFLHYHRPWPATLP